MVQYRRLRILLEKEFKDLLRDKKALMTTILLPLISLPSIGIMTLLLVSQQPLLVALVDEDKSIHYNTELFVSMSSEWVVGNLTIALNSRGYRVLIIENRLKALEDPSIDLIVVIPKDFSRNSTSMDSIGRIEILRRANVQSAINAENVVRGTVYAIAVNLSHAKISGLYERAGLDPSLFKPESFREPITTGPTTLLSPRGERVGIEAELKTYLARLLVMAFAFVVTPASTYVIDGIIGERQRKTLELLLASPATLIEILLSKISVATVLGLIASMADITALVAYIAILMMILGGQLFTILDVGLLILHSITSFFTILATVAIAVPFITRTRGIRSAGNIAGLITSIAIIFFFIGFFVDFPKLDPTVLNILQIIPYTQAILTVQNYIYGRPGDSVFSLFILAIFSLIILIVAVKTVNKEKILLTQD
ncbi:MAG: ABC transporter permease [Thermosphaera sp.]